MSGADRGTGARVHRPPSVSKRARARSLGSATVSCLVLVAALASSCASEPEPAVFGVPPRLRFETVRSILEDRRGNLWFGSWNEGVARFDGERVTYFTVADGLSDDQIRSIHEDRNGVVWFEGGQGISGFDGERIIRPAARSHGGMGDWRMATGDLWFKEDGAIGATALEGRPGVYRFDGTTFIYLPYPVPVDPAQFGSHATTGIAQGKSGRLWFATYTAVFGYDGSSFTILDEKALGLDERSGRLHVRCVLEDSQGRLWIGNNGIGVILIDGHAVTPFTQVMGLGRMGPHGDRTSPLPGDVVDGSPTLHRVFSMGEDHDGNIWFGTVEHGAWRYDGKSLRHYGVEDGLTSEDIMAIYTDRQGRLWLAGQGVFRFNGTSFDRLH